MGNSLGVQRNLTRKENYLQSGVHSQGSIWNTTQTPTRTIKEPKTSPLGGC